MQTDAAANAGIATRLRSVAGTGERALPTALKIKRYFGGMKLC
jgi:hypothetical protein